MRNRKELDAILDNVAADIRHEQLDDSVVNAAAERAWTRISSEHSATTATLEAAKPAERIEGCPDFQSLIPAYLRGELSTARALLLEDHTQECIPCRKALKAARSGVSQTATASKASAQRTPSFQQPVWRWAIAATLVVGFALAAFTVFRHINYGEARASVLAANGSVYRVSDMENRVINAGEEITRDEKIRTAKDASAVVRLKDGSLLEMKERSEFSVAENAQGTTINLDRGNLIVQAAKQKGGQHLYVATDDATVSVVGTIFSVNNGTKGSRVSVIEGEVQVDHANRKDVLRPGDQVTTSPNLAAVPIQEEISWSRDAARYMKLVGDLSVLRKEINQKVPHPGVRHSTRLLDSMPEGTVLYAALPNLSATITESHRIMQERIQQNAALRQWWEKEGEGRNDPELKQLMEKVREVGGYLGDEIAVGVGMDMQHSQPKGVLVLAELRDPAGFRAFLEKQLGSVPAQSKNGPAVRFIDDPATIAPVQPEKGPEQFKHIYVWIHDDLFAAAPQLPQLQQLAASLKAPAANRFNATAFHARIADIYREGAGLIVAADLEQIVPQLLRQQAKSAKSANDAPPAEMLQKMGLLDVKHFIVEQKDVKAKTESRAMLTFNEKRTGIASWLAAPAPMGALEFISPDANIVAAFVVEKPVSLVDDLLGYVETVQPGFKQQLDALQSQYGLNIRNDFAAPLGGEFAFAIDGPVLPTPSWKMVFEVNDPALLQQTFERVVGEMNRWTAKNGKAGLEWERADIGGRTFYTLRSKDLPVELNYTYADGYMVAAPSRALVDRALRYRETGYTLLRSPRFTAALPADGNANFSALVYHDLAPLLEPLAKRMSGMAQSLPEEQQRALQAMAADAPPTLAYAYAQGDRIVLATNSEGGPFGLGPATLFGMPSSFEIQNILEQGMREKPSQK